MSTNVPSNHKHPRAHPLDLLIFPGKSLGWLRLGTNMKNPKPFAANKLTYSSSANLPLGTSLWDIISVLRSQQRIIPSVEFKYSQEDPLTADLLLCLPANGLNLRFDPSSQRLKSIEIFDLSKTRLTYQGGEVRFVGPYQDNIYPVTERFRPDLTHLQLQQDDRHVCAGLQILWTHLPWRIRPDEEHIHVKLSGKYFYLLVMFFIIRSATRPELATSHKFSGYIFHVYHPHETYACLRIVIRPTNPFQKHMAIELLPMEFPDGTTPVASHIYIFQGSQDWRAAVVPSLTKVVAEAASAGITGGGGAGTSSWDLSREVESVIAEPTKGVTIHFPSTPKSTLAVSVQILLHTTTPQDLIADLGKPSRVFYKEEDKMRIHSVVSGNMPSPPSDQRGSGDEDEDGGGADGGSAEGATERVDNEAVEASQATDYFYNYFHFGIDVLFDGALHTCKKIVLHGNIPGHFDFQRYKRCPFRLVFSVSPNDTVSEMIGQDHDPSEPTPPGPEPGGKSNSFDADDIQSRVNGVVVVTAVMKMSEIQKRIPWLSHSASGNAPQKPVIFNRGSSGQNPFGPSTLSGYDEGVVFEIMHNGCVPTVVLF
ncbi:hypothetical protein BC938DRAFT_478921 [Jimgerdemannia flammicorona]|uniref:Uncharacterized protein n=1 Tax=Jimgerdemannia flammicorona TaxID=994334 RepID=A0A433QM07_9FUNG|nr:hypothetical protein BC938DRAFT_478921 [Jimgerdemannia flammicorona]